MFKSIMQLGLGYARNQRGSISIFAGIAALPLLVAAGAAMDYVRAVDIRTELQAAVDAAALAGAEADTALNSAKTVQALSYFAQFAAFASITPVVSFSGESVTVTANTKMPTSFMRLAGIDDMNIETTATALTVTKPVCVLALNEVDASAIHIFGSTANIQASDCVVHSNSRSAKSLDSTSQVTSTAEIFCAVGGYDGNSFNPTPQTDCRKVRDPYAGLSKPALPGCDFNNVKKMDPSNTNLAPGIYCGGLSIGGSASVTFAPGVYVMKDGPLSITGAGGKIEGTGVSFYFVGDKATLNLSGGAEINLAAPTTGPYQGLIFIQDADNPPGDTNKLAGHTNVRLVGVAYFPTQKLDVVGNGDFGITSPYMAFVADKLQFTGNGKLHLNLDAVAAGYSRLIPLEYQGARLTN